MLTTHLTGRHFQKSVVSESELRTRLEVYDQARKLDNSDQDDNGTKDQVTFHQPHQTTEILLSPSVLWARTKSPDGEILGLERVEETLLVATPEGAQEVEELPNGDGYWMESDWFVREQSSPEQVFERLNAEFEQRWTT